jgi:hypothetical protein
MAIHDQITPFPCRGENGGLCQHLSFAPFEPAGREPLTIRSFSTSGSFLSNCPSFISIENPSGKPARFSAVISSPHRAAPHGHVLSILTFPAPGKPISHVAYLISNVSDVERHALERHSEEATHSSRA